MAETIRNKKCLHQNLGKCPLASGFSVPSLWFATVQFYSNEKALPMLQMQTPGFGNRRDSFSCHKSAAGQMVLGDLFDGIR